MIKNALVSNDIEIIEKLNNKIQTSLNKSGLKYVSVLYSYIYKKDDLFAIIIVTAGSKRKVIINCLTDKEKQLLQVINLEEWKQL